MPWKVTDVMQERIRFVIQVLRDQENMSELCRRFGISREARATCGGIAIWKKGQWGRCRIGPGDPIVVLTRHPSWLSSGWCNYAIVTGGVAKNCWSYFNRRVCT